MFLSDIVNFRDFTDRIVKEFGDKKAIGFVGEEYISYSQMGQQIEGSIAFLEELGIEPGDKVIIHSQNMPNWCIVYMAIQCMGAIAVPVLPDFNKVELENIIEHSEAKAIFISESLEYKIEKDRLSLIARLDDMSFLSASTPIFNPEASAQKSYTLDENALSVLLYTSGTTGNSKGVMLSQKNLISNIIQGNAVYELKPSDRALSLLPLSHTYENTVGFLLPISKGASITYLRKPPTSSVLQSALKAVKPTFILTVPMIIEKVYKKSILPKINSKFITRTLFKFRPTRVLLSRVAGKSLMQSFGGEVGFFGIGGAKLDATVERFLLDAKFPISIGYGLTETAPLLAGSPPGQGKYQSTGHTVINAEVIIHNPDPKTGIGEIWARGNNVMLGYYKNETTTKEVLTEDGWFKTGDLGEIDKDGILSHKGRSKSLIVGPNGENVYPEDIESLINKFDYVLESVVVERDNRLTALVHFDLEHIEEKIKQLTETTMHNVEDYINDLLPQLKKQVNAKVNKASKIQKVEMHDEPFIRTATKKIKRFLYK